MRLKCDYNILKYKMEGFIYNIIVIIIININPIKLIHL